ncbi:uncharacterized protein LOC133030444 [Cannabis sativa]|uniref:uncharacterized protein LOC133030444 n=1 Tax=Cannabis sativa TaxID=3483 RepID=UPI0029C9B526|nr:uncharacterized protein LOC133030444 [Cannabis sativa]
MGSLKAPGLDGMSVLFFKHYWNSVGKDFCDAVTDFFLTGNFHRGFNTTNVTLIPKVPNPKKVSKFRPIALCNVIYKVISNFKAPEKFRHCVRQCLTTTSFNLLLNGRKISGFNPECGIRQGDPLSPYIFIWAAEILSRILENALNCGTIKGIKLSRDGPSLSHLFFADDLILVGGENLIEAKGMWQCLEKFCDWSGQSINKLKTSIFFSGNTSIGMKRSIKQALALNCGMGNINYLGLPLFRSRQKDADFNFILNNLVKKLHGWKLKLLSKAGRATLIKYVGLALPVYTMQTTKLSKKLASRIDGMVRDFWWGCEQGNRGICLRAWDHLCLPKSQGGLGFQKSLEMNQALLAKWGWDLLNENQSLCCNFWRNVVRTKEILKEGACKLIANGSDTSIWNDPWVIHGKDFYPKPKHNYQGTREFVSDLLLPDGNWDIRKLNDLFHRETVNSILRGGKPSGQGRDRWIWTKNSNGRFSTKSAYLIQAMRRTPLCNVAPNLGTSCGVQKFWSVTKSIGGVSSRMRYLLGLSFLREWLLMKPPAPFVVMVMKLWSIYFSIAIWRLTFGDLPLGELCLL